MELSADFSTIEALIAGINKSKCLSSAPGKALNGLVYLWTAEDYLPNEGNQQREALHTNSDRLRFKLLADSTNNLWHLSGQGLQNTSLMLIYVLGKDFFEIFVRKHGSLAAFQIELKRIWWIERSPILNKLTAALNMAVSRLDKLSGRNRRVCFSNDS